MTVFVHYPIGMNFDSYSKKTENARASLAKHRELAYLSGFEHTRHTFSAGDRLILYVLVGIFAISSLGLLAGANALASTSVPASGGSLTEGVVGPARFINPLLALTGPDKDLTALVYSGLMRATPEGTLIPDLAERYDISEDGTVYTFTLRNDLSFQDASSLTAEDIVFTIQRAQNPETKSARRADWEGVSVESPDARTIVFTLPHAYAPFLENATLGILPKKHWEKVSAEEFPFYGLNTRPVGSGPYRVEDVDTNATGAAERYKLSAFKKFALGEPYLQSVVILFYPNEEALMKAFNAGHVDSFAGISPDNVGQITRSDARVAHAPLPRTFGVFLNQNKNSLFTDNVVRRALDIAIDKERVVDEILKGYGTVLDGPIPPGVLGEVFPATPQPLGDLVGGNTTDSQHALQARTLLSEGGWTFSEEERVWKKKDVVLTFTLATADEPELSATAEVLAREWRAAGISVDVHLYPLSELNTVVLRPRNYEAILFGEVVGRSLDLFAFWHSSQRNDPGLNLSLYTNAKADRLLAEGRATINTHEREKLYEQFVELVAEDRPAVFLYAPEFIYLVSKSLKGVELGALTTPAERYLNVHEWHINTERVWDIFVN